MEQYNGRIRLEEILLILHSLFANLDGGFVLGGYSNSDISGDRAEQYWGWSDYWIVKVDSGGVIQWQNAIGGSDWEELNSIL